MTEEQIAAIEAYLLSAFLSMQQIANRVGVTLNDVVAVMMNMDIVSDGDYYDEDL